MANKVKLANIATQETIEISNAVINNGNVYYLSKSTPSEKWLNKYHVKLVGEPIQAGAYTRYGLDIADDDWSWVIPVKEVKERKPRQPKTPKVETPKQEHPTPEELPAPAPEVEVPEIPEVKEEKKQGHCQQPAPKVDEPQGDDIKMAMQILAMLKGSGKASIDEAQVEEIAERVIRKVVAESKPQEVVHKIQVADMPEYKMPEGQEPSKIFETVLQMVVNDRVIGRFPWLYGPAGSGKSTLAKMVADALGLPFYSVSSLQQKYELEGYSDAVGEFVQTSFYKAMADGGVFCFDEMSTTSGEVQVAFNTAAAQLVYNFPKIGMVNAHPDFHIIACDNSTGRGGDKRYISRYQLDSSTLDRYCFVEVDYTEQHDLRMAAGDKDLVKFIKAVRKAIDEANTTYLATPRASKAIKALRATGMSTKDAVWYGLCSGWNKQDIRTINARLYGTNEYFKAFSQIADNI